MYSIAKLSGLPVADFLGLAELDLPEPRLYECGSCGMPVQVVGRYPAIPRRRENDPYAIRYSLRLFDSGLAEVYGLDGETAGYFCAGCAKVVLEPAARWLAFLTPKEADAMGERDGTLSRMTGFIRRLWNPRAQIAAPLTGPKALPARSDEHGPNEEPKG